MDPKMRMKPLDIVLVSLLFIVPLLHLVAAPYTKVEESFNLQATHDILVYGIPLPFVGGTSNGTHDAIERLSAYDHVTFPGAVPRTFTGAALLAALSKPIIAVAGFQHAQLVVRAVLGTANAACLLVFWRALRLAAGVGAARWWAAMIVTQFHIVYYLTRTLPNMYAFGLTTLAFAFILPQSPERGASSRRKQAIACLTIAAAVFRSEVAILLIVTGAYILASGQLSLRSMIPTFVASFIAALALSVPIDSYLWQKWLWPELWGFYYNTVQGHASNWGVSSWHYYLTSALPRLLLNPLALPLIFLSILHPGLSQAARHLVIPSAAFIAIYSFQPHKETRFIFYVVPPLTAAAALGADYVSRRRSKSSLYALSFLVLLGSLALSLALSTGMLLLSSLNYPGGDALASLGSLIAQTDSPSSAVSVHADVLTCMTGLTLFTQNPAGLRLSQLQKSDEPSSTPIILVDKTESKPTLDSPSFWDQFDYVLLEDASLALGNWEVVGVVQGFDGVERHLPYRGGGPDIEEAESGLPQTGEDNILGLGASVGAVRQFIMSLTGGWWIGPRMSNRIRVMKNLNRA